jgi:hypothetical protein
MKACASCNKDSIYIGWIPTLTEEANFETSLNEFLKQRKSKNKCYFSLRIKWGVEPIITSFEVCRLYFEKELLNLPECRKDELIGYNNIGSIYSDQDDRYKRNLIKGIIEVIKREYDFENDKIYEIIGYPKLNTDKLSGLRRHIFSDNVIFLIGKRARVADNQTGTYLSIESVIILDITFKDFFSFCLKSNIREVPCFGIGNIFDMDTHGLILYESILKIKKFDEIVKKEYSKCPEPKIEYTKFFEGYKKFRNQALARQIYSILTDIYHIKIFHSSKTDVVNDVINISEKKIEELCDHSGACPNISFASCKKIKEHAIMKIRYNYSQKITTFTNKITNYSKIPFYEYLSYGKIRNVQEGLRVSNGEMLFGKYFIETYFDNLNNKGENYSKTGQKLLTQFDNALQTIDINTQRLENKWTFTMLLPLVSTAGAGLYYLYIIFTRVSIDLVVNQSVNQSERLPNMFIDSLFPSFVIIIIIILLIPIFLMLMSFISLILRDGWDNSVKSVRRTSSKMWMYFAKLRFIGP